MKSPVLNTPLMKMPALGLGTWPMKGGACQAAVETALSLGYRHIDTAEMYGNEDAVGAAIHLAGVPRGEIFLTTKIWNDKTDGPSFRAAFDECLGRLRQAYVDLLLVHWPSPAMDLPSILEAMAWIRANNLAKNVGVSNFPPGLLQRALDLDIVPIACLQVEHHLMLGQDRLLAITQARRIALTSYTPLGKGQTLDHPVIQQIARRHKATPAQVALAWLLRMQDVAAIPKAQSAQRQMENLGAAAIRLTAEDVAALATLPKDRRFVNPDMAPDWNS
ncbi:MAG: aldo/keto reductase [Acetobacteraceae bacterium]|nr:aldo/keto reductase [Acetobacteraceae bacterium]